MDDKTNTTYQSGRKRMITASIFIILTILTSAAAIAAGMYEWSVYTSYDSSTPIETVYAETNDPWLLFAFLTQGLATFVFTVAGIAFLVWLHRIHKNAKALQIPGIIYPANWAVTFYFLPFVNFVLPFISMLHMYKNHYKEAVEHKTSSVKSRTGKLYIWWISFASYFAIMFISHFLIINPLTYTEEAETVGTAILEIQTSSISRGALIISGIFLILIMKQLTKKQDDIYHQQ
ncbi:uncharacterized protein DUF4328 [Salsuginibacillus halophilus]|uniref:Uncharacterized protein DUF4328 n=1 Tax=Salsuginibacillus halophilus TaxID=517424 RepID=A0A2P8HXM1_9BACI|nr:DUF4328 domain-containing protein [Salsuginibacillus halophilus]PSL50986.1 uncharacterized protein DUF4328 [Salsuginibacillus halophilus]